MDSPFGRFILWQRVSQHKCSAGEHFLDDDAPAKQFTKKSKPRLRDTTWEKELSKPWNRSPKKRR